MVVVSYGITSRVAQSAIDMARKKGVKVGKFRLITAWPFPEKQIAEIAGKVKAIVVAETEPGPDGARGRARRRRQSGRPAGGARRRQRSPARRHSASHHGGGAMSEATVTIHNPVEQFLRMDRIPHIWCPGCGIGTSVNSFAHALIDAKIDRKNLAIVSGIGCTGRVAGYVNLDSFHTTHGRAIPFATGLKLANPKLNVVVYSGDGDLFAIGGNHLIHAARRNVDLKVVCINNLIYAMTGGQTAPTTPGAVITSTNPYGTYDPSFNLPYLVEAAGAVYVARWTAFHVKQLARSMQEMFAKKGFSFIEVLSPCPTLYQRRNKMGDGLDTMKFYKQVSKVRNGAPTSEVALSKSGEIVVGKFVDRERTRRLRRPDARQPGRCSGRRLCGNGGVFMPVTEIRIAGFGGQGVILSAIVIGKAGCIYQAGYSTMTQSFGPEARGGACSAQVILSDSPVLYPYVHTPDILVVMSQEAYTLFSPQIKRRRHPDHRGRPGAHRRAAAGRAGLQHSGDAHRRRTGQEDGAEHRDGRLLRSDFPGGGSRCAAQSGCGFGARGLSRSEPESLRPRLRIRNQGTERGHRQAGLAGRGGGDRNLGVAARQSRS